MSSVTLEFTGDNGWARGSVATASSLEGPWDTVAYSPLFYEIDYQGERFASEPLEVGRREARYWRLTTAEPLARERVALRLAYPTEELRVSAAGTAPYLLAAGTLAPEAGPDATFAAVWRALPGAGAPPRAALGALRELGGAAALRRAVRIPVARDAALDRARRRRACGRVDGGEARARARRTAVLMREEIGGGERERNPDERADDHGVADSGYRIATDGANRSSVQDPLCGVIVIDRTAVFDVPRHTGRVPTLRMSHGRPRIRRSGPTLTDIPSGCA